MTIQQANIGEAADGKVERTAANMAEGGEAGHGHAAIAECDGGGDKPVGMGEAIQMLDAPPEIVSKLMKGGLVMQQGAIGVTAVCDFLGAEKWQGIDVLTNAQTP